MSMLRRWSYLKGGEIELPLSPMDHQLVCVNVHWLSAGGEDGQFSFHMEGLSKHLLDDANGLRAVRRGVKDISRRNPPTCYRRRGGVNING